MVAERCFVFLCLQAWKQRISASLRSSMDWRSIGKNGPSSCAQSSSWCMPKYEDTWWLWVTAAGRSTKRHSRKNVSSWSHRPWPKSHLTVCGKLCARSPQVKGAPKQRREAGRHADDTSSWTRWSRSCSSRMWCGSSRMEMKERA